jgi:hypothetical protein
MPSLSEYRIRYVIKENNAVQGMKWSEGVSTNEDGWNVGCEDSLKPTP